LRQPFGLRNDGTIGTPVIPGFIPGIQANRDAALDPGDPGNKYRGSQAPGWHPAGLRMSEKAMKCVICKTIAAYPKLVETAVA